LTTSEAAQDATTAAKSERRRPGGGYTGGVEVQLTRDHEEFIARSVEAGRFASADEALREAVELLERRETELQGIRVFVQEGLDDLDAGNHEDFTDENLRELFDGVVSRGRQRLAAGSRP